MDNNICLGDEGGNRDVAFVAWTGDEGSQPSFEKFRIP